MTEDLLAHGLGGSGDLPVPFEYALLGATWALSISFGVLGLAWKTARYQDGSDRPVAERGPWRHAASLAGVAFTVLFCQALFGREDPLPALGAFYVLIWVGLVPIALLFGHLWRDLSPLRTVQRLAYAGLGRRPDEGFVRYPAFLGYWPAGAGLFAFVWLELVSAHGTDVDVVRGWVIGYGAITLAGALLCGDRWFDRADPFDVYSALVARMSPFVERGRLSWHNPLRSLPLVAVDRGLVALIAILLGSTAFDSFSASPAWQARGTGQVADTAMMLFIIAVVGVFFWLAAIATGGVSWRRRLELPGLMAHSLLPIVVGYVFAHYISYLVEAGHEAWIGLLGLDVEPWTVLSDHPGFLAGLKVTFVVVGHVVAVVAAHDRALDVLPRAHRLSGQLAMLLVMVGFTVGGLYLLFDT